jgi:hypothetical protein
VRTVCVALQDAGSRHAGGCRKAASTAWMIFALVPVPPSGGMCMGVDSRNHRFAPGLPPGRPPPTLTTNLSSQAARRRAFSSDPTGSGGLLPQPPTRSTLEATQGQILNQSRALSHCLLTSPHNYNLKDHRGSVTSNQ